MKAKIDEACALFAGAIEKLKQGKTLLEACGIEPCLGLSEENPEDWCPYSCHIQLGKGAERLAKITGEKRDGIKLRHNGVVFLQREWRDNE